MAGRRSKLTPELEHELLTYIRAGAFDYVAAQAVGISRATFYRWYNEGAKPRSRYAKFRERVDQARAQARVRAETSVFRDRPEAWLKYGPGRERPGAPGWTNPTQAWRQEIDRETLQAAVRKFARQYDVEEDELLRVAEALAQQVEQIHQTAGDPDLFIERRAG